MPVIFDTVDRLLFQIVPRTSDELQFYFDMLLFQIGTPPSHHASVARTLCVTLVLRVVWVHPCHFVLSWATRRLTGTRSCPFRIRTRDNSSVIQAPTSLQECPSSFDAAIESDPIKGSSNTGSPKQASTPARILKTSTRPVQVDVRNDTSAQGSLSHSQPHHPACVKHDGKLIRGSLKLTVQNATSPTLPVDQTYLPGVTSSDDPASLQRSLEQGSGDILREAFDPSYISSLGILVIARSDDGGFRPLKGPQLDLEYITQELEGLPNVVVLSISDRAATMEGVQGATESLWMQAQEGSHLFLFHTGHGGEKGMMLENKEIDEQQVQTLLRDLYKKCPKKLWVTIVFDICRDSQLKDAQKMDRHISLIWSCSLGQRAGSLEFKSRAPGSFLLNALFMAYQDICDNKPGSPDSHLRKRLKQLALYNSYRDHLETEVKCGICVRDEITCANAFVLRAKFRQDIDQSQGLGDLKGLFDFLLRVGYRGRLPDGVVEFFLKLELFEGRSLASNGLLNSPARSVFQKGGTQLLEPLLSSRDIQASQGWSIWSCIYPIPSETCPGNRPERRRSAQYIDQARLPEDHSPTQVSLPLQAKESSEIRGANALVAAVAHSGQTA